MKKPILTTVIADLLFFFMIFSELQFDMSEHTRMMLFGIVSAVGAIMIIYALVKEINIFFKSIKGRCKEPVSIPKALISIAFSTFSLIYVGRFFLVWIVVSSV